MKCNTSFGLDGDVVLGVLESSCYCILLFAMRLFRACSPSPTLDRTSMGRIMREMRSSRILANPEVRALFKPSVASEEQAEDDSTQSPAQSTSARPSKRSADVSDLPYSFSPRQKPRPATGVEEDLTEVQYSEETIPADLKKCELRLRMGLVL